MRTFALLFVASVCLIAASPILAQDAAPQFTDNKELLRPKDYRDWVFIGATLGLSYNEPDETKRKDPKFHNLFINPSAYREYEKTGKFPERTIIAMEVLTAGSRESINQQGHFQDKTLGIEVAVKDSSRFDESWAYFNFIADDGSAKEKATAFSKDRCWACHNKHAATDNVFTQFYPVLRKP